MSSNELRIEWPRHIFGRLPVYFKTGVGEAWKAAATHINSDATPDPFSLKKTLTKVCPYPLVISLCTLSIF